MPNIIEIGGRPVGEGCSAYITAEIGINHNGDLNIAKKLIDSAVLAGCDAVKFQKRTPELCVPPEQKNLVRETPWGHMTYLDYRHKLELDWDEYAEIDRYCKEREITWFASCWDIPSVDFMEQFNPVCYKIASACLTDDQLLKYCSSKNRIMIISTGMSTIEQIRHAVSLLNSERLLIAHCTSSYPCKPEELNLSMIQTLKKEFPCPIGYSGHEVGLQTTCAAVLVGACFIERHITLDRAMWGSDQAASVEPPGLMRLVRDIRITEKAMGSGEKQIYQSELPLLERLRRIKT
ncbi:MAG: N-acetylneuraminate synthase family protein [bacterium]